MRESTREFLRLWLRRLAWLFAVFAAFVLTFNFFSAKIWNTTGEAEWIWEKHKLSSGDPAVFFATREFEAPPSRQYVHVKVAGDPEYTLFYNGREIGGGTAAHGSRLDVYDVTKETREGKNRIVVALRSANGVGGFLLAVDFSPMLENMIVSDGSWKLYGEWNDTLLQRDVASLATVPILHLGRPPLGRWNHLPRMQRTTLAGSAAVVQPAERFDYRGPIREIKAISGIAVASTKWHPAAGFDFGGEVKARGRVTAGRPDERVIFVRYANAVSELQEEGEMRPFVFAKGEKVVTDPEPRSFRYMGVYEPDASAAVELRK